jgi:hypothetical protein
VPYLGFEGNKARDKVLPVGEVKLFGYRMRDKRPPTAAYYRQIAIEIMELATKAQFPGVRGELLDLAERFRRMAVYVEERYPNGRDNALPQSARDEG